jgi:hypothetical protein
MHSQSRLYLLNKITKTILSVFLLYSFRYLVPLPEPVDEELLCDVVLAVGVLEGQVELVLLVQHAKTFRIRPRTPGREKYFFTIIFIIKLRKTTVLGDF